MSPFVTVEEVAALLRVPLSRVYEWTRTRAIPCYRAGKKFVFDREETLAWFKAAQAVENGLSPVSSRRRRVLAGRRRRAPNGPGSGHHRETPRHTQTLDGQPGAVATSPPPAVPARPVEEGGR